VYSHVWRGLIVLAVSVTPGVVSSRLFSHALRGLVVLAVSVTPGVVSSRLFSHALRGLVVLTVSVTPGVVSSRLFSHVLRGLVVLGRDGRSAGHRDREVGLWREIIDCVEKNLQTSYRTLPLYSSFPLESQPARKTDTVPPSNIMTGSPRTRKTHDRTRPPCSQHSTHGNRRKDAQAVTVKKRKTDVQLNQGKTILVTNMGEGRASSINGRQQT